MKISNTQFFFKLRNVAVVLLISEISVSAADFGLQGVNEPAKALLDAPVVLVGKIESFKSTGTMFIRHRSIFPLEVEVLDASVVVKHTVKGTVVVQNAELKSLLRPSSGSEHINWQALEVGKNYVFFLVPISDTNRQFFPFLTTEFALPIQATPDLTGVKELRDSLRAIAQANVLAADESIASRWLWFLGETYEPNIDSKFVMQLVDDKRVQVRGAALAILCEYHPKMESLYTKALRFLKETAKMQVGVSPYAISQRLPRLLGEEGITEEKIRDWLSSDVLYLQRVAMGIIIQRREKSIAKDVLLLLANTKNEDLQYECIRTLSAITGKKLTPYQEFMTKPKETVKEWLSVLSEPKRD